LGKLNAEYVKKIHTQQHFTANPFFNHHPIDDGFGFIPFVRIHSRFFGGFLFVCFTHSPIALDDLQMADE